MTKRVSMKEGNIGNKIDLLFGGGDSFAAPLRQEKEKPKGKEPRAKRGGKQAVFPQKQLVQPIGEMQEKLLKSAVFLSEEENDYLYHLGMKAKRTGGKKLPKQALIKAFVAAFMNVDWDDVSGLSGDPGELENRVLAALKQD